MFDLVTATSTASRSSPQTPAWRRALRAGADCVGEDRLIALCKGYQHAGGLSDSDEVLRLLRERTSQPISCLARWLAERTIVSVPWRCRTLIPMFQFDIRGMTLQPSAQRVIGELADVLEDWELAAWFVAPNSWLGGSTPLECLAYDPEEAHQAARADRFILG